MNFCIVIITYNRLKSVIRLYESLIKSNYSQNVDLIISIDYSGNNEIRDYVANLNWPYGKLIVKAYDVNLGLRTHVLKCGNYMNDFNYDVSIILEDDVIVSNNFFNYALELSNKYYNSNVIAGISLYTHLWNTNADRPFVPINNGYDVFLMQYAQSWGQIWFRNQWNDFYKWYNEEQYNKINKNSIPNNILKWPNTSWLKYHIMYCIDKNKFFVYPYVSLATNFGDVGSNFRYASRKHQVPILHGVKSNYCFPDKIEEFIRYDSFFECINLKSFLLDKYDGLVVDLYGTKKIDINDKFLMTTRKLDYEIIESYSLEMRPIEENIFNNIRGYEIFIYNLSKKCKNKNKKNLINIWKYDTREEKIIKYSPFSIILSEVLNSIRYRRNKKK